MAAPPGRPLWPLRFGILCASTTLPRWAADALRHLLACGAAVPALLILDGAPGRPAHAPGRGAALRAIPFRIYQRLLVEPRCRTRRPVSLERELAGVPRIVCAVERRGRLSEPFSADELAAIRSHDLDFIVSFASGVLRGGILEAARHGVWSYQHDDERLYRGAPPCFWPLYDGRPTSGAILQRLTGRLDGGIVLRRGAFKTRPTYARNVDAVHEGCTRWLASAAAQIQRGDLDALQEAHSPSDAPIRRAPGPLELARFFLRQTRRGVALLAGLAFRYDVWHVGLCETSAAELVGEGLTRPVRWLPRPGAWRYLADPFVMELPEGPLLLMEDYAYRDAKGRISAVPVGAAAAAPRVVFEAEEHLSYPFVLRVGERFACVPECAEGERLRWLEWDAGSGTLVQRRFLAPLALADPTLVEHEGAWFLFGCPPHAPQHELWAWHAGSLDGPWTPHPLNPLKSDVGSARPAGPFFRVGDALYRPAQDCSRSYGGRVVLHRVLRLSRDAYAEERVRVIEPLPGSGYPHGLHTLSPFSGGVALDARLRRLSLAAPALRLHVLLAERRRRRRLAAAREEREP